MISMKMSAKYPAMKSGEIRKLPKSNSPLWVEQWAYQGTAKLPYIISNKKIGGYNGISAHLEWSCSCKSWTSTMPRQSCKHIIAVQLKEGLLVTVTAAHTMNPEMKKDFEKFLAQQGPKKVPTSSFEEKGRRFRT